MYPSICVYIYIHTSTYVCVCVCVCRERKREREREREMENEIATLKNDADFDQDMVYARDLSTVVRLLTLISEYIMIIYCD